MDDNNGKRHLGVYSAETLRPIFKKMAQLIFLAKPPRKENFVSVGSGNG